MVLRKKSILATRCNRRRFKYIKKCGCSDSDSKSQNDKNVMKNKKQKSNNSKSCKVVSKLLIPEDLMFDILSLVPVHCLLNSARYVCKPWAATIHSSLFAQACLHRARSKPSLYVELCDYQSRSYFLDIIDDVNGQFEFERTDLGTPRRMGTIVGSCDGILLLSYVREQLFVVNPILKCWLRIPPLSISKGCQFTIARVPRTTMFKLFFIDILKVSGDFWYVFYVLRIGIDNSLKEIARKEAHRDPCWLRKPLYNGGNDLYYITMKGITVVDVDKEITIGEYPLPMENMCIDPFLISPSMGDHLFCIAYESVRDHRTYEIYILDFNSEKWSLYHKMGPFDFAVACGYETSILSGTVRFWINDQIIIHAYINKKADIYSSLRSIHFSYNVKTKQLKKIEGITEEGDVMVWLHTNSLVSLPNTST